MADAQKSYGANLRTDSHENPSDDENGIICEQVTGVKETSFATVEDLTVEDA